VTGDYSGQLILPGAQGALARPYRASQAGHMITYRVEPLPVQDEVPTQAAALMISGQYVPHGSHAHHTDGRDGDFDSSRQKCRAKRLGRRKCDDCQKQQRHGTAKPPGNETCYRDDYCLQRYACRATQRERKPMCDDGRHRGEHARDHLEASSPDACHSSENGESAQGAATITGSVSTEFILLRLSIVSRPSQGPHPRFHQRCPCP
jgi:hypothetical protein